MLGVLPRPGDLGDQTAAVGHALRLVEAEASKAEGHRQSALDAQLAAIAAFTRRMAGGGD